MSSLLQDNQESLPAATPGEQTAVHEKLYNSYIEKEEAKEVVQEPPNGGLQAWLTVLAAFFIFVNTWGVTAAYGAFQTFYQRDLLSSQSPSSISWIGSVQSCLVIFSGVITGPLFDRGYLMHLIVVGCFLLVFGMMMTSLATSYYQVFLAQGLCVGLGAGICYIPSIALVAKQFTTKRPFAIGCASTGSSIGGIIFPIMFQRLQPAVGYGWAVRAIAFVNLGTSVIAILILGRHREAAVPSATKRSLRSLVDLKAFRELPFTFFTIALFWISMTYYIPLFYIAVFASESLHSSDNLAFYLLAVTNAGSFFGRTIPFLLAPRFGAIQIIMFFSVSGIIVLFSWISIHSAAGFIVFCIIWGFISGILITGPQSAVSHPALSPSLGVIGTRIGMSWSAGSIGVLVGAPIAGALVNSKTADFLHMQVFVGVTMTLAALSLSVPLIAVLRYRPAATPA